jgi:hypothetical protein
MQAFVGAGVGIPLGDVGVRWNMGLHSSINLAISMSPGFSLEPKLSYHGFSLDRQKLTGYSGGSLHALIVGVDFRYFFPSYSPVRFFVVGGIGTAAWGTSDLKYYGQSVASGRSESNPVFSVGWGTLLKSSESADFFIEMRYNTISASGISINWIPITFGLRF